MATILTIIGICTVFYYSVLAGLYGIAKAIDWMWFNG
jgi:hypothetical protein